MRPAECITALFSLKGRYKEHIIQYGLSTSLLNKPLRTPNKKLLELAQEQWAKRAKNKPISKYYNDPLSAPVPSGIKQKVVVKGEDGKQTDNVESDGSESNSKTETSSHDNDFIETNRENAATDTANYSADIKKRDDTVVETGTTDVIMEKINDRTNMILNQSKKRYGYFGLLVR